LLLRHSLLLLLLLLQLLLLLLLMMLLLLLLGQNLVLLHLGKLLLKHEIVGLWMLLGVLCLRQLLLRWGLCWRRRRRRRCMHWSLRAHIC
jgi:hypothetical protein